LGDAAPAPTVPLADGLAQLIRSLPKCATGRQLVQFMNAGLELTATGGLQLSGNRDRQPLSDAINSPASIGIVIPWFPWSEIPTYCAGAAQREKAIGLVTRAVGSASGEIGATAVKVEAVKELAADLAKPPFGATDWGAFLKKIAIGAVVVGGIVVAVHAVPAVRRMVTR
jgi:hypothetical protein